MVDVALQHLFYILEIQVKFVDHKKSNLTEEHSLLKRVSFKPVADRSMFDMCLIRYRNIFFFPKLNR